MVRLQIFYSLYLCILEGLNIFKIVHVHRVLLLCWICYFNMNITQAKKKNKQKRPKKQTPLQNKIKTNKQEAKKQKQKQNKNKQNQTITKTNPPQKKTTKKTKQTQTNKLSNKINLHLMHLSCKNLSNAFLH